ncbi:hypothetical protein Ancab_005536 [Ancistrocladus abbreviatus]
MSSSNEVDANVAIDDEHVVVDCSREKSSLEENDEIENCGSHSNSSIQEKQRYKLNEYYNESSKSVENLSSDGGTDFESDNLQKEVEKGRTDGHDVGRLNLIEPNSSSHNIGLEHKQSFEPEYYRPRPTDLEGGPSRDVIKKNNFGLALINEIGEGTSLVAITKKFVWSTIGQLKVKDKKVAGVKKGKKKVH